MHTRPFIPLLALAFTLAACADDDTPPLDTSAMTPPAQAPAAQPAPSADDRDDTVERALDADSTLRMYGLDADDDDNRIVLKGTVRTAVERDRAGQVAAAQAAGLTIDNRIEIDANRRVSDQVRDLDDLEDQIEDAFEADSTLRGLDLDVDEDDGQLVLEGTVRTAAQQTAAQEIARRLAGTTTVVNRLRVQQ